MPFSETADIETSSDGYAKRFSGSIGSWFLEVQRGIILNRLKRKAVHNIIDVGGGHGQLAFAFVETGLKTSVISSSAICGDRIQPLIDSNQCTFYVGDLIAMPFPDKSFDAATCIRYLPHCTQWKQAIKELCRISQSQVIVDYPPIRSFNFFSYILFPIKKMIEGDTRPFTLFSDSEIICEFEKNGFTLENRSPQFLLPMALYRKLKNRSIAEILEGFFRITGLTYIFGSPTIASFIRKEL